MKNYFEYKNYIGKVEMSAEDGIFFGKIHGINDLVTFEGENFTELKKAFMEAVDDYLELCRECEKEPQKAYKGQFNVRISPELHKKLAVKAIKEDLSLNQIVEDACDEYINKKQYECNVEGYFEAYLSQINSMRKKVFKDSSGWQKSNGINNLKLIHGGIQ